MVAVVLGQREFLTGLHALKGVGMTWFRIRKRVGDDVLAAMPANNAADFNTQIADLAAAAPASVVETAKMMKPAGEGVKNNLYEYALTGLASYASANP